MLVLTRKVGDVIAIGDEIKIVVMAIKGKQVRLGVQADRSTVVHREEIYQKIQQEIRAALQSDVNNSKVAGELLRTATEGTIRMPSQNHSEMLESSKTQPRVLVTDKNSVSSREESYNSDTTPAQIKPKVRKEKKP